MELRSTFQSIISLQEELPFALQKEAPNFRWMETNRDCYWHSPLRKVIIIGTYD